MRSGEIFGGGNRERAPLGGTLVKGEKGKMAGWCADVGQKERIATNGLRQISFLLRPP